MIAVDDRPTVERARVIGQRGMRGGTIHPADRDLLGDPAHWPDAGVNLGLVYEGRVDPERFRAATSGAGHGVWRRDALMPLPASQAVTLGEGGTPLFALPAVAEELGIQTLRVKDESQNPTWSFKDRLSTVGVSWAVAHGRPGIVVSSTGNAGAAAAAYAARAGLPCLVLSSPVSGGTMQRFMASYGAMVVATPSPEGRWALNRAVVEKHGWLPLSNTTLPTIGSHPAAIEGCKSIAYEIAEDLGWRAPAVVVVPTAYGDCIVGIHRGFRELVELGLVERMPRLVAAESAGSIAAALELEQDQPVIAPPPDSAATSINVVQGTVQALDVVVASGGTAIVVPDPEVARVRTMLAHREGMLAEFSAALGVAAVGQLRGEGWLAEDDEVVVISTSTGLKDLGLGEAREVPVIEPELDELARVLRRDYGAGL